MSGDSLDALVVLYRREARELPSAGVDARILHFSERGGSGRNPWAWRTAALAACILLAIALLAVRLHEPPLLKTGIPMAGFDEGRAAAYLMQVEPPVPRSAVAQNLLTMGRPGAPRPHSLANTEK